jgi:type VI secretion system protein ImpL
MTQKVAENVQDIMKGKDDERSKQDKIQLNQLWQNEVMQLYAKGIQGRYPFSRANSKDVTLDDFGRFFAQGGVVDGFFSKNADASGKNWHPISQNGSVIAISPTVLAQIQAATKIRQMFFVAGGTTPSVKFNLKPLTLAPSATSFWLNIEGQQSKYSQNEVGKNAVFSWPGTDGSQLVSFGFDTTDGRKLHKEVQGQWAWFRALEIAKIRKIDQTKYILTFDIDGLQASYELNANSVDNPFSPSVFDTIRFPQSL